MARKILFITTDQMRYDALGCNGGKVARTPVLDRLAHDGLNYQQMIAQNVVCMPARASMISGQYPQTHGVWMNGVPLPADSPSVAALLHEAGYKTALIGKAHFEPWLGGDAFYENSMAAKGEYGPHRGFDHMETANHFILGHAHYDVWMNQEHQDQVKNFYPILSPEGKQNHAGGGATGAVQCWHNPTPRELYHTDWIADRVIAFLDGLDEQDDWFIWMSFPDPHHPWDPPAEELGRVAWQELDLPALYPQNHEARIKMLEKKPGHWLAAYLGSINTNYEMPPSFQPASLTADQVREINAMTHIENELIDEACGRVLAYIEQRSWNDETDIIFTTDHGEMQGDFGLMFKGPFHVDALMRLPLLWRPAAHAQCAANKISAPVGHIDIAPTICHIADLDVPSWMEGAPLPQTPDEQRERALTAWESVHGGFKPVFSPDDAPPDATTIVLQTITRDHYRCTRYLKSSLYDGSEGELYDLGEDPGQLNNLWDDPKRQGLKSDLIADMRDHWPKPRSKRLPRLAPV